MPASSQFPTGFSFSHARPLQLTHPEALSPSYLETQDKRPQDGAGAVELVGGRLGQKPRCSTVPQPQKWDDSETNG